MIKKIILNIIFFLAPTFLACQNFSGELIIGIVDSNIIDGNIGDLIIEIIDGVETPVELGPKDIGRTKEWHRDTALLHED